MAFINERDRRRDNALQMRTRWTETARRLAEVCDVLLCLNLMYSTLWRTALVFHIYVYAFRDTVFVGKGDQVET